MAFCLFQRLLRMVNGMNSINKKSTAYRMIGVFLIIAATVLWGSSFAVRKAAMTDIGPLMFNALRFFAAFVFMMIVFFVRKLFAGGGKQVNTAFGKQIKAGIIIGMLYGMGSVFQQLGLNLVSAGETGFVTSLYSVMVPVLARILFKTKIRPVVWVAVVFSGTGLYFVTGGGVAANSGMLILLMCAFCFALQIIAIAKFIEANDALLLVIVQLGIGAAVNLIMAVIAAEPFEINMVYEAAAPVLYTGIMSLGVANFCQFAGQSRVSPTVAAIICSFESVFGLLFGIILLDEKMTGMKLTGCVFILAAVILSQLKGKNRGME